MKRKPFGDALPVTEKQALQEPPLSCSPYAEGSTVALSGEEIRQDLQAFLSQSYRGEAVVTSDGRLDRLYACCADGLARLICLMIDRLCHEGPVRLHLCEVPGALELSLTLPHHTPPSPDIQYQLLSAGAAADVALHVQRAAEQDAFVYTVRMREDFRLPTLRAAGMRLLTLLRQAWKRYG